MLLLTKNVSLVTSYIIIRFDKTEYLILSNLKFPLANIQTYKVVIADKRNFKHDFLLITYCTLKYFKMCNIDIRYNNRYK